MPPRGSGPGGRSPLDAFTREVLAAAAAAKEYSRAASPQGLKGLDQSFDLLKATLGTAVLPGFVMLGAAVATASDALWNNLKPKMDDVAKAWAEYIPTFVSFAKGLADATQAIIEFAKYTWGAFKKGQEKSADFGDWIAEKLGYGPIPELGKAEGWVGAAGGGEAGTTAAEAAGGEEEGGGGFDYRGAFLKNLRGMATDMRRGMGGGGGFSGIADVAKQIQQQSFQSNMQTKFLDRFDQTVRLLERISGNTADMGLDD